MPITKEQQSQIEYELCGFFGRVELLCDGHKITAAVKGIGPLKQVVAIYIDGEIKGEWARGEDEFVRKFHRESKRYLLSKREREMAMKNSTNRYLPKEYREYRKASATKTLSFWYPYWTSAKLFLRHISKTCAEIEVVKIGPGS